MRGREPNLKRLDAALKAFERIQTEYADLGELKGVWESVRRLRQRVMAQRAKRERKPDHAEEHSRVE